MWCNLDLNKAVIQMVKKNTANNKWNSSHDDFILNLTLSEP